MTNTRLVFLSYLSVC